MSCYFHFGKCLRFSVANNPNAPPVPSCSRPSYAGWESARLFATPGLSIAADVRAWLRRDDCMVSETAASSLRNLIHMMSSSATFSLTSFLRKSYRLQRNGPMCQDIASWRGISTTSVPASCLVDQVPWPVPRPPRLLTLSPTFPALNVDLTQDAAHLGA